MLALAAGVHARKREKSESDVVALASLTGAIPQSQARAEA